MSHPTEISTYLEHRLPVRLMNEIRYLAEKYREKGVRLFVFGSFARAEDKNESDLDIGVLWTGEHSPATFSKLYWDMQELPTIRLIDLVDMNQVEDEFRREAMKHAVFL